MSIASEITRLQNDSAAIASAIEAKGVTVPSGSGFDDYAGLIANISGGGSTDDWIKDGDTHLWINILTENQLSQSIRIRMIGTIDWGDGTAKETANVTTYTTFTHAYTNTGRYRIDLHPTSGVFYLGGASSSYNVMGSRTNPRFYKYAVLYQVQVGRDIITSLSSYAFYYCAGVQRVFIPKNITSIATSTFYCNYALTEVIFEDATKITTATLTSNFHTCNALQVIRGFNIRVGTSMTTPIRNCYCLREFTIPGTVTSIAANSFANTYSMKYLYCLPTTPPTVDNSNAFSNLNTSCVIAVPYGSLSAYQSKSIWSDLASQMAEAGLITYNLTNVSSSNNTDMVISGESYTTMLTPDSGYTLGTVTVTMGGIDITSSAYSDGVVTIANVTGNITIKAEGAE